MTIDEKRATLTEFIDAFNQGNLQPLHELLTTSFYDYRPHPGEQTAPEAFRQVGDTLLEAFPDMHLKVMDVVEIEGELTGSMTLEGTYSGSLWGVPGQGQEVSIQAPFFARFSANKMAICWKDVHMIGNLRRLDVLPTPENAHLKHDHPLRIPEIITRLAYNGMSLAEKPCSHIELIQITAPATHICEQCVASGDNWPALRMCLICGYVGCCDLSVNKHMKQHCEETGHMLIRSIAPGEGWIWCYADNALLPSWHLGEDYLAES